MNNHHHHHDHHHEQNSVDMPVAFTGTIHPFLTTEKSMLKTFTKELSKVAAKRPAKRILIFLGLNFICTIILLSWCHSTNSMALTAYTYLTIFDIFSILTCLLSLWVQDQESSPIFSFGYGRFEVLAVFASTILAQLGSLFILKESVERIVEQPDIHTGRLIVGTALAFTFQIIITYTVDNKAFNHVVAASSSSWLQEHMTDMSESVCKVVPGLSKILLPRTNPMSLIAFAGAIALIVTYILIDINNYYAADTWAAVWIAIMTMGTMFPMSIYSGKILLQTTPSHVIGQLDKCIREASTLDGVLEFRNEHFWTLAFGTLAGSVHVRIRRDADEQMVLAHVINRLSNIVSVLTIQIFKDDWSRASAYQIINESTFMPGKASPMANNSTPRIPIGSLESLQTTMRSTNLPSIGSVQLPYPNIGKQQSPTMNLPSLRSEGPPKLAVSDSAGIQNILNKNSANLGGFTGLGLPSDYINNDMYVPGTGTDRPDSTKLK